MKIASVLCLITIALIAGCSSVPTTASLQRDHVLRMHSISNMSDEITLAKARELPVPAVQTGTNTWVPSVSWWTPTDPYGLRAAQPAPPSLPPQQVVVVRAPVPTSYFYRSYGGGYGYGSGYYRPPVVYRTYASAYSSGVCFYGNTRVRVPPCRRPTPPPVHSGCRPGCRH
jgi:hypothetical protein